MAPVMTCIDCVFFIPDAQKLNQGQCRRMPPTPFPIQPGVAVSLFPAVRVGEWCGELRIRDLTSAKE